MIIIERHDGYVYKWHARYGDRLLLGHNPDALLFMAWAVWGGNVPALVHT